MYLVFDFHWRQVCWYIGTMYNKNYNLVSNNIFKYKNLDLHRYNIMKDLWHYISCIVFMLMKLFRILGKQDWFHDILFLKYSINRRHVLFGWINDFVRSVHWTTVSSFPSFLLVSSVNHLRLLLLYLWGNNRQLKMIYKM